MTATDTGHHTRLVAPGRCADAVADFWDEAPELAHIRDAAHSRVMAPAAVLGAVLAYRLAEVPPNIQLPPIVGDPQSLNLFCALYGAAGDGKSATETIGRELLGTSGVRWCPVVASGEKLAGLFARPDKESASGITFIRRSAVLFYDEVTALAGMAGRSGSTLLSWLLSAWSGRPLGAATQDRERSHPIPGHSYRLCLLVGVQGRNAHLIIDHEGSGLPQRFLWLPTVDPVLGEKPDDDDIDGYPAIEPIPGLVDIPRPELADDPLRLDSRRYVEVCATARREIRSLRRAKHRGDVTGSDAHRALLREKVAAGLSLLRPGVDMPVVDEAAWTLAGRVLTVLHDRTLADAASEKSRQERARIQLLGRLDDVRAAAAARSATERIGKRISTRIPPEGWTRSDINRFLGRDRIHRDAAIDWAEATSRLRREGEGDRGTRWFAC